MDRLKVFVSSRTRELRNERVTIREALKSVNVETFIFEDDAGARTETTQEVYANEVENCDIYVGIFRAQYSSATEEEYRIARARNKEILVYVSDYNAENRDERLKKAINEIKELHTVEKFEDVKDLAFEVHRDITIGSLYERWLGKVDAKAKWKDFSKSESPNLRWKCDKCGYQCEAYRRLRPQEGNAFILKS